MERTVNWLGIYFREFDGYGHSGLEMVGALLEKGVDLRPRGPHTIDDRLPKKMQATIRKVLKSEPANAPIAIYYCLPSMFYDLSPSYQVGFTQFETNRVPEFWIEDINRMDEVWTTCDSLVDVFKESGVTKPIYTVPLGIDSETYTPIRRKKSKPFKFLHMGLPEHRKGFDLAIKAYRLKFLNHMDEVRLTIKGIGIPQDLLNRLPLGCDFILSRMPTNQLVALYHESHAFVYPTRGEGWGMIPMEALSTGLPTLMTPFLGTEAFAKYAIPLDYRMVEADYYEHLMPCGEWAQADIKDLADKMEDIYINYEKYEEKAYENALKCAEEFSWGNSAAAMVKHLERIWEGLE